MATVHRGMRFVLVSACFTMACFAQGLLEHAAAAGGTAGAMGGKKVSDAIDSIFKKADGQLQKSGNAAAPVKSRSLSQEKSATDAGAATPTGKSTVARKRATPPTGPAETSVTPVTTEAAPTPVAAPAQVAAPAPPPIEASPEVLAKLDPGTPRQDVVARLGAPAYKISMEEDGHLLEIYHYTAKGADIGSVRIIDGTVATVRQSQN